MSEEWDAIRGSIVEALVQQNYPATFQCSLCDKEDKQIIWCPDCGPSAYFCRQCSEKLHCVVFLHVSQIWNTEVCISRHLPLISFLFYIKYYFHLLTIGISFYLVSMILNVAKELCNFTMCCLQEKCFQECNSNNKWKASCASCVPSQHQLIVIDDKGEQAQCLKWGYPINVIDLKFDKF